MLGLDVFISLLRLDGVFGNLAILEYRSVEVVAFFRVRSRLIPLELNFTNQTSFCALSSQLNCRAYIS